MIDSIHVYGGRFLSESVVLIDRVLACLSAHDRVSLLFCEVSRHVSTTYSPHNALVTTLPVINVLAFYPIVVGRLSYLVEQP